MKIPGWWRVRHFYNAIRDFYWKRKALGPYLGMATLFDDFARIRYNWIHSTKKTKPGINIIGYAKGDFGLAEHLRLTTNAMNTTSVSFCINNTGDPGLHTQNNEQVSKFISENNPYFVNLFCFNADQTILYMKSPIGGIAKKKHYNIGYGYWELSVYPHEWTKQNKYLNEIWAPSRFIKKVIEKSTPHPVFYMPIPVDFDDPVGYSRRHFNLPENGYLFLFTFDMSSFVTRKNPDAVIKAFVQAFPVEKKDDVILVVKLNRIHVNPFHTQKVNDLKKEVSFDPRIIVFDEILDRPSILGLISVCDAYVSLHRSEGFGLGMAEAMKMGKVVIATHYSGNEDFMNKENSCPVRYKLIDVGYGEYCYIEKGAQWAEPDVDQASDYMKKVYEDKDLSQRIGSAARAYIKKHHSFEVIGENYQKRLREIMKN